jgi:hypothetical protein
MLQGQSGGAAGGSGRCYNRQRKLLPTGGGRCCNRQWSLLQPAAGVAIDDESSVAATGGDLCYNRQRGQLQPAQCPLLQPAAVKEHLSVYVLNV